LIFAGSRRATSAEFAQNRSQRVTIERLGQMVVEPAHFSDLDIGGEYLRDPRQLKFAQQRHRPS